eukprot:TRINITY_DN3818_c0_g1_i3.p1 TRINITY_DN3818_c0_g1~~TRINITY_DN3818_c0_g1_i3.p1  ORF type:complete len:551 (-),score=96.79 TRINITY_DN3818_c0_g1_i3:8-1660(-)
MLSVSPGAVSVAKAHETARQADAASSRGRYSDAITLHRQAASIYQQSITPTTNPESMKALQLLAATQLSKIKELERISPPSLTSGSPPGPSRARAHSSVPIPTPASSSHHHTTSNPSSPRNYMSSSPTSPSPSSLSSSPYFPNYVNNNPGLSSSMYEEENLLFVYPSSSSNSNNQQHHGVYEGSRGAFVGQDHVPDGDHLVLYPPGTSAPPAVSHRRTYSDEARAANNYGLLSSSPPSPESSRFWLGLEKLLDILPKPIFRAPLPSRSEDVDAHDLSESFFMVPAATPPPSAPAAPRVAVPPASLTTETPQTKEGLLAQVAQLQQEVKRLEKQVSTLTEENARLSKGVQKGAVVKQENMLLKRSIVQFRQEVQRKATMSRSAMPTTSGLEAVPETNPGVNTMFGFPKPSSPLPSPRSNTQQTTPYEQRGVPIPGLASASVCISDRPAPSMDFNHFTNTGKMVRSESGDHMVRPPSETGLDMKMGTLDLHSSLEEANRALLRGLRARSLLSGEQSNTWRILLRNDRKSRHRRIKKQRRFGRLAATSQLSLW